MSAPLLPGAIAVSCASGMTLPTVAKIRPIDASVVFAMSVPVAPADFVQPEDVVAMLV